MKTLLSILICVLSINAYADSYTKSDTSMKDNKKNVIATITKGTKVQVIKTKGNQSYIKISGWAYEDEPNEEIFPKMGVTVTLASLKKQGLKLRKIHSKKEDLYEEVWMNVTIKGWIPTSSLTQDFNGLWKMESTFASERCGACHSEPKADNYEAVQFPALINGMKETAGLTDEEEAFVVNYFQKNNIYGKKK